MNFLVKGYVNVFCEMVKDGGGWMVNEFFYNVWFFGVLLFYFF